MEMDDPSTTNCSVTKENCCRDKQIFIEGQNELKISFEEFNFDRIEPTPLLYPNIVLLEGIDKKTISFQEYKPPSIVSQLYKIGESFLI